MFTNLFNITCTLLLATLALAIISLPFLLIFGLLF